MRRHDLNSGFIERFPDAFVDLGIEECHFLGLFRIDVQFIFHIKIIVVIIETLDRAGVGPKRHLADRVHQEAAGAELGHALPIAWMQRGALLAVAAGAEPVELGAVTVDLAAQRGGRKTHRDFARQVPSCPFENRMGFNRDLDKEVGT